MSKLNPLADAASESVDTLIVAAKTAMAQKGPADALPLWQAVRDRFPHLPAGHVGYAEALKEAGKLDEAEVLLAESIRRFPEDPWAWVHFAQTAMRRSDWTEALRRWQEIRERFPDIAAGSVGYAEALVGAGRLEEAESLLSGSIHRFPNEPWAWIHYARACDGRANWTEPLRRWQAVQSRFPDHPVGATGYADALKQAERLEGRCRELLRFVRPKRVLGFRKARFGSPHDGGYVMIDDFNDIDAAFSFGIAQDASWDAAVADHGVPVYQFDHTIEGSPMSRPDLIFARLRIAAKPVEGAQTIDELVRRHGSPGQTSLILKIDIEGDEWAVFDAVSDTALSCFAQIVGEFHFLGNVIVDMPWYEKALRVFRRLAADFGVVHVHANNGHGVYGLPNVKVPHLLEITFANRRRYKLGPTYEVFPGPLDAPNDPNLPDIPLGRFVY